MCRENWPVGNLLQSRQALQQAPDVTYVRKARSVNDRRSHQCARPGWRPRQRTPRQRARAIAEAIRRHRATGDARGIEPSDFTPDAETQVLVRQLLAVDATPQR